MTKKEKLILSAAAILAVAAGTYYIYRRYNQEESDYKEIIVYKDMNPWTPRDYYNDLIESGYSVSAATIETIFATGWNPQMK